MHKVGKERAGTERRLNQRKATAIEEERKGDHNRIIERIREVRSSKVMVEHPVHHMMCTR